MIHDSIVDTIGNTPIVRIRNLAPPSFHLYAKLEAFKPRSSAKDRLAWAIIHDAETRAELTPGRTVVEATSGNTGIALAMVCAARGYPSVAVIAESFSVERRRLMRFLRAKVLLTLAAERGPEMIRVAEQLARRHDWFLARRLENPADLPLDYFVSAYGTGGTITGRANGSKPHARTSRSLQPSRRALRCWVGRSGRRARSRDGLLTSFRRSWTGA